jgi:hypothetical protein
MPVIKSLGGRKIIGTSVAVMKAGDGLSESIAADGAEDIEIGGHYFLLMEVDTKGLTVKQSDDDPRSLLAKYRLNAGTTTFVDKDLAAPLIEAQAVRNEAARIAAEEAKGIHRFPMGEDDGDGDDVGD